MFRLRTGVSSRIFDYVFYVYDVTFFKVAELRRTKIYKMHNTLLAIITAFLSWSHSHSNMVLVS